MVDGHHVGFAAVSVRSGYGSNHLENVPSHSTQFCACDKEFEFQMLLLKNTIYAGGGGRRKSFSYNIRSLSPEADCSLLRRFLEPLLNDFRPKAVLRKKIKNKKINRAIRA